MRAALPAHISTEAQADLGDIKAYVAIDSPSRARRLVEELRLRCVRLGRFPHAGRRRWDIDPDLRSVSHKGYIILYEVFEDHVGVVRIVHGARDLPALFRAGQ